MSAERQSTSICEERGALRTSAIAAALAAIALLTVVLLLSPLPAAAHSSEASLIGVEVYDRASGTTLDVYEHDGQRFVIGTPGHEYALRIRNRSPAAHRAVGSAPRTHSRRHWRLWLPLAAATVTAVVIGLQGVEREAPEVAPAANVPLKASRDEAAPAAAAPPRGPTFPPTRAKRRASPTRSSEFARFEVMGARPRPWPRASNCTRRLAMPMCACRRICATGRVPCDSDSNPRAPPSCQASESAGEWAKAALPRAPRRRRTIRRPAC